MQNPSPHFDHEGEPDWVSYDNTHTMDNDNDDLLQTAERDLTDEELASIVSRAKE